MSLYNGFFNNFATWHLTFEVQHDKDFLYFFALSLDVFE